REEARRRPPLRESTQRVSGAVRTDDGDQRAGREHRNPHQDGRDSLLSEFVGSAHEGGVASQRAEPRTAVRPECGFRRRRDRAPRRPVRRRPHHHRRAHRRVDERTDRSGGREGVVAATRQRGEGGRAAQIPHAATEPVPGERHGLGPALRPDGPDEQRQEPPRRGEGVSAGGDALTARPPLFTLRVAPRPGVARLLGLGAIALCLVLWWIFTAGATPETRMISPVVLPSPGEVLRSLPSLLTERALLDSVAATLRRVLTGFALAILVGVPF